MIIHFSIFIDPRSTRRIDTFLASLFPHLSRSYVQRVIDSGRVKINGKVIAKNTKIYLHDEIEADFSAEKNKKFEAEEIPIDVVFENTDFAIINKDPFMNVHPVPGEGGKSGTLVNALMHHFGSLSVIGGIERPGIAHRLDKDTSGLIFIAKSDKGMKLFQRRIAERKVSKTYLALTVGIPSDKEGYIESFIGRDPDDRKRMTVDSPINPKLAKTRFKVLGTIGDKYALLEVDLLTGRTHQIRLHLATIGFPILGDTMYGRPKANAEALEKYGLRRQWLHAFRLEFDLFRIRYRFSGALKADLLAVDGIDTIGDFRHSNHELIRHSSMSAKEDALDEEDDTPLDESVLEEISEDEE